MPAGSTRVAFALTPEGGGTRVTVTHTDLPSTEEEQNHAQGWRFHLSRLNLVANRAQLAAELPRTTEDFFRAWDTDDDEERNRLLEASCTDDVEFSDDYASSTGRDVLALHVSNTRKYIPNATIRLNGDITVCRGEALIPWETVGAEGESMFGGIDYVRVAPDGRFSRIVGFWTQQPTL